MMTIQDKVGLIEDNLFSFYKTISLSSGSFYDVKFGCQIVRSGGKSWPDYILGKADNDELSLIDIAALMKSNDLPSFWIRNSFYDEQFEQLALDKGIRKVFVWHGMYFSTETQYQDYQLDNKIIFSEIETVDELTIWIRAVNNVLMSGKKIDTSLFNSLLNSNSFRFFTASLRDETIATLMFYIHDNIAGIYLVSVKADYRRRGIGKWLTTMAMNRLISSGISTFVLHSTPLAFNMYKDLGFDKFCQFSIYWMVGKF